MQEVNTRTEYDYIVKWGYQPLLDWRYFKMNLHLRIQIQKDLFGAGDFQQENQRFYKWCWEHKQHNCEETAQPLHNYAAIHVSHIISKGSDRRIATDPRNVNLLIHQMHTKWETSEKSELMTMNIYKMNRHIIKLLKDDYNLKI